MLCQSIFLLSFVFLFSHCDRKAAPGPGAPKPVGEPKPALVAAPKPAPVAAPKPAPVEAPKPPAAPPVPQVADGVAAVALVWSAPSPDEDAYANEEAGESESGGAAPKEKPFHQNHPDLGARTFWVVPAGGTGAWTVVAQRPGLFVAVGDRVLEARTTPYRRQLKRPAPKPEILEDGTKDWECGEPFPGGIPLEARGSGLSLRAPGEKPETPVIGAPENFDDLDACVQQYEWWVEPVGGLGRYLFLNHRTNASVRSTRVTVRFVVFDLERMTPVQASVLPVGTGGWRAVVDDPAWRPDLQKRLKTVIGELGAEVTFEPDQVALSHLWPVFPDKKAVGLELAFRHAHDCFPCPALEVRKTVDALPPELAAWRKRHPALDAVAPLLPKSRRVAGITVLVAPPERAKALFQAFEAVRGK